MVTLTKACNEATKKAYLTANQGENSISLMDIRDSQIKEKMQEAIQPWEYLPGNVGKRSRTAQ